MNHTIEVTKASGQTEPFSMQKLRHSLTRAKASPEEIDGIIQSLLPKLHQHVSTKKIYSLAFRLLQKRSKHNAARYNLKQGMLELGPTGFPFEKFMGEIFKHQGYDIQTGVYLPGKCVIHEIDVVAKKENQLMLMECKYRNLAGMTVDIKTPLYIRARFDDIQANDLINSQDQIFTGWIATNSRFTEDALVYGKCAGLRLISWDYPDNYSLRDMIDNAGLYPLTCLTTLTTAEKQWLLTKDFVLARDIADKRSVLLKAGVNEARLNAVFKEIQKLCVEKQ